jgi:hypothetical protein
MNGRVVIGLAAATLLVIAGAIIVRRTAPPDTASAPNKSPLASGAQRGARHDSSRQAGFEPPGGVELIPPPSTPATERPLPTPRPQKTDAESSPPGLLGGTPPGTKPEDAEIPDEFLDEPIIPVPIARAALGFVGVDPEAEEVWFWAINDPTLSPKDRKDLIEDLNEDGFPDPKNITVDDLPLILSRIELIEEIGPDAMDDTNAEAFAEAYKDLVKMLARLSEQQQ